MWLDMNILEYIVECQKFNKLPADRQSKYLNKKINEIFIDNSYLDWYAVSRREDYAEVNIYRDKVNGEIDDPMILKISLSEFEVISKDDVCETSDFKLMMKDIQDVIKKYHKLESVV